jgi:hypothetical protein
MNRYDILLVILVLAALSDLMVPFILGTRYPGYSHLKETISAMGSKNSPVQKFQCLNLIFVGFLFVLFAAGSALEFTQFKWSHKLFILGIVLFGVGTIIAGIFPEDPRGVPETYSGKIHGIASGIGFLFFILSPLWSLWIVELKRLNFFNLICFFMAVLTFILFIISERQETGILKYTGLFQRVNLLVLYLFLIINYIGLKPGL